MVSVVIPTRNRCATLVGTLARVLRQNAPGGGFEVIVVDNGSTDDTSSALHRLNEEFPGRLRQLHEPVPGPAAARNRGAAAATGEVLVFLGDDMEPANEDLLARHAELHEARPQVEYAVLGRARWSERWPVTPLMRWLETGPQFAFDLLSPGPVPAAGYFYTAHLSLKKAMFHAAGGFDTRFPYAAVEDMELGIRLAKRGLTLDYRPDLLVLHSDRATLGSSLQRMRLVGRSAALLQRLHPEATDSTIPCPTRARRACVRALAPLVTPLDHRAAPGRFREFRWRILHQAAYSRGYGEGLPDRTRA